MNLFGFNIDGLDIATFGVAVRTSFLILILVAVGLLIRRTTDRSIGRIVFAVAVLGFALAWFATMYPLPNVYGTNGSQDRENHLGWANVVAQGFSPLRTFQVNHLHFEPVWPLLTAIASGFSIERVPLVFQWAPLAMAVALAFTLFLAWTRGTPASLDRNTEAGFAVLGALLLLAAPGDSDGIFRNPWALTFLLKPNHVLALVVVPLAALALARARDWKTRLLAGFVLQLVGWAFVIHMALFVLGLFVFVMLSWLTRNEERRRDLIDVVTAVGANLLIVSPYLFMLVVAYPFLHGSNEYRLSFFSERPFEGPFRLGVLTLASGFGAWHAYRTCGRLGRIFSAQWLTAQIVWQAFPVLGLIGQAREQDEAFYWCRFWTGLFAGVGAFRLAALAITRMRRAKAVPGLDITREAAALSLWLLLPSLLPTWWNPQTLDQYFVAARKPLPASIDEPTRFIKANTPKDAVFAGDRTYARWIAAYGGRRVLLANSMNLPNDSEQRMLLEDAILQDGLSTQRRTGMDRYGVQYFLMTSRPHERALDVTTAQLKTRAFLEVIYEHAFPNTTVTIFKIRTEGDR